MKRVVLRYLSYERIEAIKSLLATCAYFAGAPLLLRRLRRPGAAILVFHSVGGKGVFRDNVVDIEEFQEQLTYLKGRYRIVSVGDIVERLHAGVEIPDDWVALTFDDGYRDNCDIVLPLLQRYGVVGAFYVTVGAVEKKLMLFYDRIHNIVHSCAKDRIACPYQGRITEFSLGTQPERDDCVTKIVIDIRAKPAADIHAFVRELAASCEVSPCSETDIYLGATEVRALAAAGMEIGSHTLSHPNLPSLSEEECEREVAVSRERVAALIGRPPAGFAYPYGKRHNFNPRVIDQIRRAGYRYAVTTISGKVTSGSDPYRLPRIGVGNWPLARLKLSLAGISL